MGYPDHPCEHGFRRIAPSLPKRALNSGIIGPNPQNMVLYGHYSIETMDFPAIPMNKIRVLVVDDSFLAQQALIELIETDPDLEVAGTAQNGKEGVAKTQELKPDLVTMDLNMPVMNGQDAIDQIMSTHPCPILVVSSNNDSKVAFDACSRGALDVFPKDDLDPDNAEKLTRKIKLLSKVRVIGHIRPKAAPAPAPVASSTDKKIVAIACSTGGPKALSQMLAQFPESFPHPIVIAQHIECGFLGGLIDWLRQVTPIHVEEGRSGARLGPSQVVISPPERHMCIRSGGRVEFEERTDADIFSPSCDKLLTSVAQAYGKNCIGIILTGMAQDGVKGMQSIRAAGGTTIAQDEATSVVYGMNRQAIEAGCIDKVLPLQDIAPYVTRL